ncbi:MAG: proteasome assembly chaperone family protein [Methanomassiliicoccales archaeon]|nr:MAG: proteasome assembly chaperone family protein [Methanomassiliicoccales archaeon]
MSEKRTTLKYDGIIGKTGEHLEDDILIHERKEMDLENGMLVIGFPTIGLVGPIAAHHLMSTMKLTHIGSVYSKYFQPTAVIHNYVPTPPVNIFAGEEKCGPEGTCDQIIVVESEFLPPPNLLKPLGNALMEWSEKKKITLTTVLEGMLKPVADDKLDIFGVGSTEHARSILKKYDLPQLEAGMVSGISGVMLYEGERLNKDVICLLAETHVDYPDARAAAEILNALNHLLPQMKIDPEPLLEKAEEIEERIKESIKRATPQESKKPDMPFPIYR